MNMITLTDKLAALLEDKFQEPDYQHLFLIEIKQSPGDKIEVFLDSDTGVKYEHCVRMSRFLEEQIESNNWLGEKYTLDVSSAGVGVPLRLKRQFVKNIGRPLSIELHDNHKHLKGTLVQVEDDNLVIEYEEKVKVEGKKKKRMETIRKEVLFMNIKNAKVIISF